MSARSKKSKQSSDPEQNAASHIRNRERSASPMNISRNDEKEEMIHLNNRLASYIEFVRKLERDKEILNRKIRSFTEESVIKSDDARKTFETEIDSLRRLVDDLAKDKTAADLKANKHKEDAADAKAKLSKRDLEVKSLQRKVEALERELSSYKQDHDRYLQLKPEHDALEKRCEVLRRDLEAETILRTGLENKVAGLREEIEFKDRLHKEDRNKLIRHKSIVEEQIEEKKAAEYQSRLAEELEAFRQQTADGLLVYRQDMEQTFQNKLNQLRAANSNAMEESHKTCDELMLLRKRADDLNSTLAAKNAELEMLKKRVDGLEGLLAHERDEFEKQLNNERDKVKRLQTELELRFSEFTDLMNTKIALDQEILMYRKMLESEESRLHISSPSRNSAFSHPSSVKKRRYANDDDDDESHVGDSSSEEMSTMSETRYSFSVTKSSQCGVEFTSDQDGQGKWVKLINSSDEDIHLGNWTLKHQADGSNLTFKFHRTVMLKPDTTCIIWSSDAEGTHSPPSNIVMKNQAFRAGVNIAISLVDPDGQEQAKCTILRERLRVTTPLTRAGTIRSRPVPDEKCFLM